MTDAPKPDDEKKPKTPDLKDVEPGSDADETPKPDVGKIPPKQDQKEG
jgi:hypothetical protein